MSNEQANNNPQRSNPVTSNPASGLANSNAQKLSAKIKETWAKLTDAEIALYEAGKPSPKFFEAVQTKYSISPDEAAKTVKRLEAECGSGGSTGSGTASGGAAKAANDSSGASSSLPKAANS